LHDQPVISPYAKAMGLKTEAAGSVLTYAKDNYFTAKSNAVSVN